jgi:hypothetical protein
MLPIVNQTVEAEKLSIYDARVHAKYPLNGLRLKNTTNLHLMQGPITVFDAGAYAGDARMEDLSPGGERLISYAIDLDVEVASEESTKPETMMSAKVVRGVMSIAKQHKKQIKYTVKNSSKEFKKVLIERPISAKLNLVEPEKDVEKTRDSYRFSVSVPEEKSVELTTVEEEARTELVAINGLNDKDIQIYLSSSIIDGKIKKVINDVEEKKRLIAEAEAKLSQMKKNIETIGTEQERIRQNMTALDKTSDLYRRYVKTFGEQEDELANLRKQCTDLSGVVERLTQELADYVTSLTFE